MTRMVATIYTTGYKGLTWSRGKKKSGIQRTRKAPIKSKESTICIHFLGICGCLACVLSKLSRLGVSVFAFLLGTVCSPGPYAVLPGPFLTRGRSTRQWYGCGMTVAGYILLAFSGCFDSTPDVFHVSLRFVHYFLPYQLLRLQFVVVCFQFT